ncbi:MAG TPA: PIN domain-containing protein [Candidatus Nanoarchaeia archaeon]|nr:PIN domain-containing protein [Candidatus Nanoarchaeia archaeon]
MRLVIDTNKIIAALIRDSTSRRIIFHPMFEFITPSFTFTEILEHELEIMEKAHLDHKGFTLILSLLLKKISVIPKPLYESFLSVAKKIISDPKDISFIAVGLALNTDGIWTDDNHFKKQKKLRIYTTSELFCLI